MEQVMAQSSLRNIDRYSNRKRVFAFKHTFIVILTFIAIILGKIVRWFFSGETFVSNAIGSNQFLQQIPFGEPIFSWWTFDNSSVAGDNIVLLFKVLNVFGLSTYVQFEIFVSIICNIIILYPSRLRSGIFCKRYL